jgi:hypothetical protein
MGCAAQGHHTGRCAGGAYDAADVNDRYIPVEQMRNLFARTEGARMSDRWLGFNPA